MALAYGPTPIRPISHLAAPESASRYPQHLLRHVGSFPGTPSSVSVSERPTSRLERTSTVTGVSTSFRPNRPLPSLPRTNSVTGSSAAPTAMTISTTRPPSPPKKSALKPPVSRRSHVVSVNMPQRKTSVASIVNHLSILPRLLSFLPWADFLSLSQTCRSVRNVWKENDLRDLVLSRYVEGYGACLKLRSPSREGMREVPVTLHDLDLLLISQRTALHIYPTTALSTLSSHHLSDAEILQNRKLAKLTHTHSRFVLLLQSLAHNSSLPPPLERAPEFDPIFPEDDTQPQGPLLLQRVSLLDGSGAGPVRELVFPAPLSCPDPKYHSVSAGAVLRDRHRHTRSLTGTESDIRSRQTPKSTGLEGTIRPDPFASLHSMKRKNRRSIFGRSSTNPPPPPADPRDLKYYSTGWRQSLLNASFAHSAKRASTANNFPVSEGWVSDDDLGFNRPHRRFDSSKFNGSSHSFSSTSGSASGYGGFPLSQSERHSSPSPPLTPVTVPSSSFPHDLLLATSRVRAPILRVYVPCAELSDGPEFLDKDYFLTVTDGGSSIQKCEDQLFEAGLWEHMSTGDVVCNLGYVPFAENAPGDEDSPVEEILSGREFSRRRSRSDKFKETRTWLVFNGDCLVPFCLPEDLLPIDDPISLPSPFYYDHLLPATPLALHPQRSLLLSGNIRMVLRQLPSSGFEEAPQLLLVHAQTEVLSPHSRGGVAVAKKWIWIARVWRGGYHLDAAGKNGTGSGFGVTMGIGWKGEWIIEGEGTKEGRQALLDCLKGEGTTDREFEFLREKSGGGRIWLRCDDFLCISVLIYELRLRMLQSSSVQLYPSNSDSFSSSSTQTAFPPRV
ncbi:uncharacterized protein BT62DRAFT_1000474 [Guyanagaster necrorhizus]|uniref:F-box domain-containing protein n=1 Tax=Guyanagaster necrorhizus TaxID=856835 RepID=A0A9P7W361_9AGAR|nr:uncharacterized protein BT62DRAFT_1000474 [Guyanagaster necrorhizus MCA 3950]KAG7451229.1 hypothetical protein BT62DRAFT_1000474 [Guyanagaster necrorhizus MCA 3950]